MSPQTKSSESPLEMYSSTGVREFWMHVGGDGFCTVVSGFWKHDREAQNGWWPRKLCFMESREGCALFVHTGKAAADSSTNKGKEPQPPGVCLIWAWHSPFTILNRSFWTLSSAWQSWERMEGDVCTALSRCAWINALFKGRKMLRVRSTKGCFR